MKKLVTILTLALAVTLGSCGGQQEAPSADTQHPKVESNGKKIFVDVRSVDEWNNDGHADCAVNIPIDQFADHIEELKAYGEVSLVCKSGGRAGNALNQLKDAGYTNAQNLGAWTNIKCDE